MNTNTTKAGDIRSHNGSITLVLGGVRSGKSRFAQDLATRLGGDDVLFVATAEAGDGEMARRIDHHRKARPSAWKTLECPLGTGQAIAETKILPRVVLIDCLTLLVSNVICDGHDDAGGMDANESRVFAEVDALIDLSVNYPATNFVVVSGEVGSGIVPEHALGRLFRDLLGLANQRLAASATATYWMVAGLAINATTIASTIEDAAEKLEGSLARGVTS